MTNAEIRQLSWNSIMPEKERVICVDIYRLGKLISWSTSGEAFKSPRFPREFWKRLAGADKHHYAYRPFVFGSSVKKPLLEAGV